MTAKEYLRQVRMTNCRIDSKLVQLANLRDEVTRASALMSDMPSAASPNRQSMENIIVKIVDLEREINEEIDQLVDLKRILLEVIRDVGESEYQALLEMRYLGYKTWEDIAGTMGYELRWIYRIHAKALQAAETLMIKKGLPVEKRFQSGEKAIVCHP